ncbi:hypothetical protein C0991_004029, partial [Blastosporella zonata]
MASKQVFTIQEYLSNACLPTFRRSSTKLLSTTKFPRALTWPRYSELQKAINYRALRHTKRTEIIPFINLVKDFLSSFCVPSIDTADYSNEECSLRLPSPGYVSYDDDDIQFLKNIDNEEQFVSLMQNYVLSTVSESLRILYGHARHSPDAAALQFRSASHLCVAHHARWDVLALPGTLERPYPFFVFFISPSEFGIQDMWDIAEPRE